MEKNLADEKSKELEPQISEIEAICRRTGLTYQELGFRAGIKPETMRKYSKGYAKISELAMASLRNIERLSIVVPVKAADSGLVMADSPPLMILRKVPVVSWASAGRAHDFGDLANQIDEMVETECRDQNAFALIAEGDSMEPEIFAGDIIVFSPNSEPRNGDVVVARLVQDGGVLLKRFSRSGERGQIITLTPRNPDYPVITQPVKDFRFIYPAYDLKRKLRR